LNVLKAYQAIAQDNSTRFVNFARSRPVLAKGATGPLEGDLHSAQYFHGRDGLSGITERHPELNVISDEFSQLRISSRSGAQETLDILREYHERSITYVALGPMTNLALLLRSDAQLVRERIGRVIAMGGALDVPGNTSPVAEFNFFADPFAVKELLLNPDKGLPLDRFLLLPLDITTPHELPFELYKWYVDPDFQDSSVAISGKPPISRFTSAFLERTREIMLQFGKDAMELHDIVAVWCAIENPPYPDASEKNFNLQEGWKAMPRLFDIERYGELTRGMLVVDRRDDESAYHSGAIRSEVQKQKDFADVSRHLPKNRVPVRVEVEMEDATHTNDVGVPCVVQTPGPSALLRLLLQRVWGVDVPYHI
ncbi:nucleoside hydrolase, partial [Fistulina hepatica ATCC 64428]